jgi:hypothetical protein
LNPVKGKVTYKDSPAGGVLVTLHPAGGDNPKIQPSTGYTTDDGTFEIQTGQEDGAPAGEYSATFVWMQEAPGKKKQPTTMTMSSEVLQVDKLKGRYTDRKNPTFSHITIKKGPNELETFKLQ